VNKNTAGYGSFSLPSSPSPPSSLPFLSFLLLPAEIAGPKRWPHAAGPSGQGNREGNFPPFPPFLPSFPFSLGTPVPAQMKATEEFSEVGINNRRYIRGPLFFFFPHFPFPFPHPFRSLRKLTFAVGEEAEDGREEVIPRFSPFPFPFSPFLFSFLLLGTLLVVRLARSATSFPAAQWIRSSVGWRVAGQGCLLFFSFFSFPLFPFSFLYFYFYPFFSSLSREANPSNNEMLAGAKNM